VPIDIPVATELPPLGRALERAGLDIEELARLRQADGPILIWCSARYRQVDPCRNVRLKVRVQTFNRSTVRNRDEPSSRSTSPGSRMTASSGGTGPGGIPMLARSFGRWLIGPGDGASVLPGPSAPSRESRRPRLCLDCSRDFGTWTSPVTLGALSVRIRV